MSGSNRRNLTTMETTVRAKSDDCAARRSRRVRRGRQANVKEIVLGAAIRTNKKLVGIRVKWQDSVALEAMHKVTEFPTTTKVVAEAIDLHDITTGREQNCKKLQLVGVIL
ncbi:hypothetical protein [Trichlorobacter ammonificans]|uniref:hypothetical protein n=1 Tax=Trichlorobacter ammonificans TaxID=2916410 RepID=UPI002737FE3C|nr:hypothetical protein [Trichlorobacter ammonificans]